MTTRIAFLGDTLLGGEAQATLDHRGYDYAFDGLAPILDHVDLVVANHEGPLTTIDKPVDKVETGRKRYWYRALPESASALRKARVGVVSLANNHVLDFGSAGLADTIQTLDTAGIAHCGAGTNESQAREPAIVNLGDFRVGFLSVMQRYDVYVREHLYASETRAGPARLRIAQLQQDLAALESQVDLRIVLVHWGRNYRPVTARQTRLAARLSEAGADLVVGHHPHIPQRLDLSPGAPTFFSLGNGPLGTPGRFRSGRPPYGLVATVELHDASEMRVSVQVIAVDNTRVLFRPVVPHDHAARRLLAALLPSGIDWRAGSDPHGLTADLPRPQAAFASHRRASDP